MQEEVKAFDPREALARLGWDRMATLCQERLPRELAERVPGGKRMPLKVKRCLACRLRPEVRMGKSLGFVPMGFLSVRDLETAQVDGTPLGIEVLKVDVLPCCARRTT